MKKEMTWYVGFNLSSQGDDDIDILKHFTYNDISFWWSQVKEEWKGKVRNK